jgi:hypothetical protein
MAAPLLSPLHPKVPAGVQTLHHPDDVCLRHSGGGGDALARLPTSAVGLLIVEPLREAIRDLEGASRQLRVDQHLLIEPQEALAFKFGGLS